eukprot:Skav224411  [mRNA]  locus=scaffold657:114335:116002:+ [translate_table: standard]
MKDGEESADAEKSNAPKHAASPHKEQRPAKCSRASELEVHQKPPSHMQIVANDGGGNCLFLATAQGINDVTKREKPLTHRMLRASVCKSFESKPSQYKPFWDEKCPSSNEEPCNSWEEYLSKLKRVGAWGGHLELRAIAELYNVQICVLSPGGVCNTVNDKSEKVVYLWLKGKHYELLRGAHPTAWIQDLRAAGYTGGRGGGKRALSSKVHTSEADSEFEASVVRSCEIDSAVFSRRQNIKIGHGGTAMRSKASWVRSSEADSQVFSPKSSCSRRKRAHTASSVCAKEADSSILHTDRKCKSIGNASHKDMPRIGSDKTAGKVKAGWKCPICQLYLKFSSTLNVRRFQHLKHWRPDKMHEFVRVNRWQPRWPHEKPTWKCPHCAVALYGAKKSNWDLRMEHWRKVHPSKPKEDFVLPKGRPSGTSMRIPSIAKRNALVSKNLQLLKGNCNGHQPVEVTWPFAPKHQGLVKKFICKACLRTAHLPKLLKNKCTNRKLKDKRRVTLLSKIRRKIAQTKTEPEKANLQTIASLYASCNNTSHRSKTCEAIICKQRSCG